MREKLQIFALLAEIIGSIAVVISLVVVAVELNQSTEQQKQNTLALQLSAYQEAEAVSQNFSAIRVQDREFNEIWQKFVADPNSLTYAETSSATVYATMIFNHGKLAYFQYQKGLLDDEQLASLMSPLTGLLRNTPIARHIWRGYVVTRKAYGVSFGSLMEGTVAPPLEGARFDVPFEGESVGPKLKGKVTGVHA